MTEVLDILFTYLCEGSYREFLPLGDFLRSSQEAKQQESALISCLSPQQRELLDQLQCTQNLLHGQEMEAMFLAAWNLFKELR